MNAEDLHIGSVIAPGATALRDAIHIAVAPATALHDLQPGEWVSFVGTSASHVISSPADDSVGVVDPYIGRTVCKGERFWLFLRPGSITSLRHDWTHPAFEQPMTAGEPRVEIVVEIDPSKESPNRVAAKLVNGVDPKEWIENYVRQLRNDDIPISYDELMDAARDHLENGEGFYTGDNQIDLDDEFWKHYQALTGVVVPEDNQYSFFRCAC